MTANANRAALGALCAIALLSVAACGGDRGSAATGGALVISVRNLPNSYFPPLTGSVEARQVNDLIFDRLALIESTGSPIGDSGFTPRLARSWQWSTDSLQVAFSLHPDARWHDGAPVVADDFVYSFAIYRDTAVASPRAADLRNVDSVTATGEREVTIWFRARTPLQFHDAVMSLVPVAAHVWRDRPRAGIHADPLLQRPIGNGPFRFDAFEPNQFVKLVADSTNPRGRPALDRVTMRYAQDDATHIARLLSGEVDVMPDIRAQDQLDGIARDSSIRVVLTPGFTYGFIQFNLRAPGSQEPHPVFGEREARRALALATDRHALSQGVFGPLASVAFGPFVRAQFIADTTIPQIPFDRARAEATLDSLGWTLGRDGIRARRGRRLSFTALVPNSAPMIALGTLLQAQWRAVGADLRVQPVDQNAYLSLASDQRRFDVVVTRLTTTQSFASLPGSWGSRGSALGGRNIGAYLSEDFDAHVDTALTGRAPDVIRAHLREAFATIVADAPAIFVFEQRGAVALSARVQTPALRPDAWWLDIPAWHIAESARLPRDVAGVTR